MENIRLAVNLSYAGIDKMLPNCKVPDIHGEDPTILPDNLRRNRMHLQICCDLKMQRVLFKAVIYVNTESVIFPAAACQISASQRIQENPRPADR